MMFFLRSKLFISFMFSIFIISNTVAHALPEEGSASEFISETLNKPNAKVALSFSEALLSSMGDVAFQGGEHRKSAAGLKVAGSLYSLIQNIHNPSIPRDGKALCWLGDGMRTLSYFSLLKETSSEKKNPILSVILRAVSAGADWYTITNSDNKNKNKKWGIARLVSLWSRVIADGLSGNAITGVGSLFSSAAHSIEALRVFNPEMFKKEEPKLEEESGRKCTICLDEPGFWDSESEYIKCGGCGQIAGCRNCLNQLLEFNGFILCPLCRKPIDIDGNKVE